MKFSLEHIKKLFILKARYAAASGSATVVDYGLWFLLKNTLLDPVTAHFISYPVGVLTNFALQKRYIFNLQRKLRTTFLMAMTISAFGWGLGTLIMYFLVKWPFFAATPVLAKMLVNVLLFFYNFYLKRYAFEKRFFEVD
jgi:putative flippase GtrA